MSSKSSLFLTGDNEHCYEECNEQHYEDGLYSNTIYLEMLKKNIDFWEDDEYIVIKIEPGSELYNMIQRMNDINWGA